MQELINNIKYNKLIEIIAQEVLIEDEISVIAQEGQLRL